MVGIIYKDCICIGNVEPRFNYCGSNKDIIIALDKIKHHIFNIPAIHFTMNNCSFYIGTDAADLCLHFLYIFNPVMNKKYLPVAGYFIFNSFLDDLLIEAVQFCDNGHPVRRRSIYDREIACSHKGKLQCAGYRSGS